MKLLIIEDDKDILSLLTRGLKEAHHTIDTAQNGEDGEYLASINQYDIIILDWMLPLKSGIEVLQSLRNQNITTSILMLSAKGESKDKIEGLRNGSDDYLAKPFNFAELEARLEALYRRTTLNNNLNTIEFYDIQIDLNNKTVSKQNVIVNLSLKEYELLIFLIKHKNSYVSKPMIEDNLWNNEEFVNSNVIEVTIYNLRKKIGKDIIKNFRGMGYKIEIQ